MNKIKARKEAGAVCPVCKHPDYVYLGRCNEEVDEWWAKHGKLIFKCTKCGDIWHSSDNYGEGTSKYMELL